LALDYVKELMQGFNLPSIEIIPTPEVKLEYAGLSSNSSNICYWYEPGTEPSKFFELETTSAKYLVGLELPESLMIAPQDESQHHDPITKSFNRWIRTKYQGCDMRLEYCHCRSSESFPSEERSKLVYWDLYKMISSVRMGNCSSIGCYFINLADDALHSHVLATCIKYHIPVIVNKCALSIEYLGDSYPGYDLVDINDQVRRNISIYLLK